MRRRTEEASTTPELLITFQVLPMATAILVREGRGGLGGGGGYLRRISETGKVTKSSSE